MMMMVSRLPIGAVLAFWTGAVLSTLIFAVFTWYAMLMRASGSALVVALIWCGFFAAVIVPSLRTVRRVELHADQVVAQTTLGLRRSVRWNDTASVRTPPPGLLRGPRLTAELVDRTGKTRIRLTSQLDHYDQLVASIEERIGEETALVADEQDGRGRH